MVENPLSSSHVVARGAFRAFGALLLCVVEEQIFQKNLDRKILIKILISEAFKTIDSDGRSEDSSAIWKEWKKTDGKGCFASASIAIAENLVVAMRENRLLVRPPVPMRYNGEALDTTFESEELIAAFRFLGSKYWENLEESQALDAMDNLIFRMARIDYTGDETRFLDLETKEHFTIFGDTSVRLVPYISVPTARKTQAGYTLRNKTLVAAIHALDSMTTLRKEIHASASFVNLDASLKDNCLPSGAGRQVVFKIIEASVQEDLEALVVKVRYLCDLLYSDKKYGKQQANIICRSLAKELGKMSRS